MSAYPAIDPPFSFGGLAWSVQDATCALLMRYANTPAGGYRVVPGAAVEYPSVARDGMTYTFRIRKGLRFSNGAPVTARNFKHAAERAASPSVLGGGGLASGLEAVAGFGAYSRGRSSAITGITANGRTLVFRLQRPTADFPARMTVPYLCPVPLALPTDPEGVRQPFPGSGPYFISSFSPGRRLVLARNRFYRGRRPHRFDHIVVTIGSEPKAIVRSIEQGAVDTTDALPPGLLPGLARRHGNSGRFRSVAGAAVFSVYFNQSRPLFRNLALRRAVNFALDRRALVRASGPSFGRPTDQYLPPKLPGFRDAHVYPLAHPDFKHGRSLARGRLRRRRATIYISSPRLVLAQVVRKNLARIGLDVTIRQFPSPVVNEKIRTPGEPWDLTLFGWEGNWVDPYFYLNGQLETSKIPGRGPDNTNVSHFRDARFERAMKRVSRLGGTARFRAYGRLDAQLARDAAPMAAFAVRDDHYLLAKHIGCFTTSFYGPDLGALCRTR